MRPVLKASGETTKTNNSAAAAHRVRPKKVAKAFGARRQLGIRRERESTIQPASPHLITTPVAILIDQEAI
ncbi:unnamed protein product [Toxocara canis]|uniref:Uncharacterized protein n=1 Tax=Toxocara canis TaxID=6265 RepID=A0A183TXD3_TOXCA|nr:unnamed protein product [Toxocara canis]